MAASDGRYLCPACYAVENGGVAWCHSCREQYVRSDWHKREGKACCPKCRSLLRMKPPRAQETVEVSVPCEKCGRGFPSSKLRRSSGGRVFCRECMPQFFEEEERQEREIFEQKARRQAEEQSRQVGREEARRQEEEERQELLRREQKRHEQQEREKARRQEEEQSRQDGENRIAEAKVGAAGQSPNSHAPTSTTPGTGGRTRPLWKTWLKTTLIVGGLGGAVRWASLLRPYAESRGEVGLGRAEPNVVLLALVFYVVVAVISTGVVLGIGFYIYWRAQGNRGVAWSRWASGRVEKLILLAGTALLLACVCFPPYQLRSDERLGRVLELGRGFVLSPPRVDTRDSGQFVGDLWLAGYGHSPLVVVNWSALGLQAAAVVLLTAFAFGVARVMAPVAESKSAARLTRPSDDVNRG